MTLVCTSCGGGGGLEPVRGKVLYKGEPAKGAVVSFHPVAGNELDTIPPTGVAGEDGSFSLSTRKPDDGAAPGHYVVTVVWPEPPGLKKAKGGIPERGAAADQLKGNYADKAKSTLKVEIKKGTNQLEPFDLK
jgi:hypothetical protein